MWWVSTKLKSKIGFIKILFLFIFLRCNRLFRTNEEVEFHAAKTGHSQFSESTDEKKPLTEEEKKEQLRKVEELMKLKRKEREEKEKN